MSSAKTSSNQCIPCKNLLVSPCFRSNEGTRRLPERGKGDEENYARSFEMRACAPARSIPASMLTVR